MKKDKKGGFGLMIGLGLPKPKTRKKKMFDELEDDELDEDMEDDEEDMELEDEEVLMEDEEEEDMFGGDSEDVMVEAVFESLDNRDVESFKENMRDYVKFLMEA